MAFIGVYNFATYHYFIQNFQSIAKLAFLTEKIYKAMKLFICTVESYTKIRTVLHCVRGVLPSIRESHSYRELCNDEIVYTFFCEGHINEDPKNSVSKEGRFTH